MLSTLDPLAPPVYTDAGVTYPAGIEIGPLYWASTYRDAEPGDFTHHRDAIVAGTSLLAPFDTVTELGCHRGENLLRIRDRWPNASLTGVDLNPRFLAPLADSGITTVAADVGAYLASPHPPADVYVFCYVLAYLPPERAHAALYRALQLAKRGVILAEPITTYDGEGMTARDSGEYLHNFYRTLLRVAGEWGQPIHFDTYELTHPADSLRRVLTIWSSPVTIRT